MNYIGYSEQDSLLTNYDISVCIITYNREKYITEAIESVLSQNTNLKYEIVIGDNCSSDHTVDILKDYYRKHPEIFHLVLNDDNIGITKNRFQTMCHAKGKFIIMLDGDDYWIDYEKLQKQFIFLQSHSEYIGVATSLAVRYGNENQTVKILPAKFMRNRKISLSDFLDGMTFPMTGMLFRRKLLENNINHFKRMVDASEKLDDGSFCVLFLMLGNVYTMDDTTAVYRNFRKEDSKDSFNASNSSYQLRQKSLEMWNNIDQLTEFKLNFGKRIAMVIVGAISDRFRGKLTKEEYTKIINEIEPRYRKTYLIYVLRVIFLKIYIKIQEK